MRRATMRLVPYAGIAAFGLLSAVAVHRAEPALLALPFAAVVLLSVITAGPLTVRASLGLDTDRAIVGDRIEVDVVLEAPRGAAWVEVELALPAGLAVEAWSGAGARAGPVGVTVRLPAGAPVTLTAVVRCERWGAYRPGRARVLAFDRFRLLLRDSVVSIPDVVRVHPPTARLRELAEPRWLQGLAGAHRSRERADGIEYAETRPWAPGDRLRAVNWRVSARRGTWFVSDRHPDRSADVILLLDSFVDVGRDVETTLGLAVEAVVALAHGHLGLQDRVGLVGFGGYLDWLVPDLGARQLHKVVDAVLDTQVVVSLAERSLALVPPQALPPRAFVVALTPLVDPRSAGLLARVKARGCDLAVVEVSPLDFLDLPTSEADRLAHRAWAIERDVVRQRLRSIGATVVEWRRGEPFATVMAEVTTWRAGMNLRGVR
ncbi:MAG: DUF58 domain-containing protein [Acidimicrobiales bacterium]